MFKNIAIITMVLFVVAACKPNAKQFAKCPTDVIVKVRGEKSQTFICASSVENGVATIHVSMTVDGVYHIDD